MKTMAAVLSAVVLFAACGEDTAGPAAETPDFELASYDVFGDGYGLPDGPRSGPPGLPILGRLVMEAYAKVRTEQGEAAAQAKFATLHQLRQEATAARRAGNIELFREKIAAMHQEAGRLVVEILGAPRAQQLIDLGEQKLAALDAVIAARSAEGLDVTRLQHARTHAAALLAAAEESLADGDILGALIRAARGAQLAAVAAHHGTRVRP